MKQPTKRFLSMLAGLVLLLSAIVIYFQLIQPAYEDAQGIKAQELSSQSFLASEKSAIEQVLNLKSTYQSQTQIQNVVSLALPLSDDLAGALAQLYGMGQASGLSPNSFSVSEIAASVLSVSKKVNQNKSQFTLKQPVGTVNFGIRASGSYDSLKGFISKLETNIRIFDVQSLVIQPVAVKGAPLSYNYDISATTYFQIAKKQ